MSRALFRLPDTLVSKDVIERVKFSVSSRNAGSKVSECLTHVFVSRYCDDPSAISWQYVSSGVTCLLRKKELAKSGRKMVWTVHMCLYNVTYGVLVWKGAITLHSCYTAVSDTFHVFAMHELNAIVGILFDESAQAREFLRSYLQWDAEKVKEDRSKGGSPSPSPAQLFRKEMISKPCNFQHIQGTQALDECMEIERIKTDIQAAFFGLGPGLARRDHEVYQSKGHSSGKRKKDAGKPRIQFQNIAVPHKMSSSKSDHMIVQSCKSLDVDMMCSKPPPGPPPALLMSRESVPAGVDLCHSMPPQVPHHQSQPDLLTSSHQSDDYPTPRVPVSPQFDSLPHQNSDGLDSSAPRVSPRDKRPHSPQYDKLPLNGLEDQSLSVSLHSAPSQNGSDPHSPPYNGAPSRDKAADSPVYDSLQKSTRSPPELSSADEHYNPQLYVDAIVDNEVAGYSAVTSENNEHSLSLEYTPPARLSPLNFEKEFSQSKFFHPAYITSTTNC